MAIVTGGPIKDGQELPEPSQVPANPEGHRKVDLGAKPEIPPLPRAPAYETSIGPKFAALDDEQFVWTLIEWLKRRPQWHWTTRPKPGMLNTLQIAKLLADEKVFDAHEQDIARRMTGLAQVEGKFKGRLSTWVEFFGGSTVPHNQHYWGLPLSELPEIDK